MTERYAWTPLMDEISGFGGTYEVACRAMVSAGCGWLDDNPGSEIEFSEYEKIFGLAIAETSDAKRLEQAMVGACVGSPTGAMFHAAIRSVFFVKDHGWPAFVKLMEHRKADNDDEPIVREKPTSVVRHRQPGGKFLGLDVPEHVDGHWVPE